MKQVLCSITVLLAATGPLAFAQQAGPQTTPYPAQPARAYSDAGQPADGAAPGQPGVAAHADPVVGPAAGSGGLLPGGTAVAPADAIPGGPIVPDGSQPSCAWDHPCGPPGRFWISAEYLLWWIKDSPMPPLVTASPAPSGGILGNPGTVTLFGGSPVENSSFSGGRFTGGFWLNQQQTVGLEGGYFFLGSRSVNFNAAGSAAPGEPTIGRPFFNPLTGREDAQLVSFPGELAGSVRVNSSSRLQGFMANGICNLCCGCNGRLDLLGGFRYVELREGLGVSEDLTAVPTTPILGGSHFLVNDQFDTRNRFYGGQVGARGQVWWGNFFANATGLVALGDTHQVIDVNGNTSITPPGGPTTVGTGGLLAQPSNIGHFSRDRFAVIPQGGVNVGYQITPHLGAFVGYTILYWSSVARPGDQIDRVVNPTEVTATRPAGLIGPARPAPIFQGTDFWAQGINFGITYRY